ncbi:hypothetical protein A2778_05265 [Candidatus Daviesbacteria bacterium RIFCSPHIGHO2_01_FULL_40_24]|nr:MAG: Large extracellular alpha-helical protein [Candidatus Daviesbacteria bacterium GW2011_GWA2_39_33]OGE21567.1 MAG: hypothetical protein A2778_05265 [Candidatus Daviesbacteria bacterium RIFCSPHIGHO2_01_FULL_40_24]OGE29060.1 MAG: hypothetical protein A3C29_06795 [Candidatus Daviesbacteria bacterium RIFCSPHIGHO2_02_FULL_40_16]OGE43602.1 MAG: hypothetical protein A3A53_03145 [Candidatus Daviesbacteria bacterium RIFCSPLOWO2_01_FULL_39_23]OGE67874.1 MAG: hypothetical protein A3J16_03035 [Candid
MSKIKRLLLVLFLFILGFYSGSSSLKSLKVNEPPKVAQSVQTPASEVLGRSYQSPQIYISGSDNGYASGGLISLASTDEPAVIIGGYNLAGDAEVSLYEADENHLLDYLTHDKEGKQTKKSPDVSKLQFITTVNRPINTGSGRETKISLPLGEKGIWYLKVKTGSTLADAFVLRSNIGVLSKEGDNEFIFWGQNFKTKRSISEGTVKILNLQDGRKQLQTASFNAEGIAKTTLVAEADIGLFSQNDEKTIIPLNLKYLNTGYSYEKFLPKEKLTRYFIFVDRPLYKPGDTVYFKTVLRDDDDARYSIPPGEALVKIRNGYNDEDTIFEKTYPVSPEGTINGEYKIPESAKTGYYGLVVDLSGGQKKQNYWSSEYSSNSISFDVEYFKKPEFSIDITTPKNELIASDKTSFKITGTYFSGQPLMDQKVKYTVYSSDFSDYHYLSDRRAFSNENNYRYAYWGGNNKASEGTATLNKSGEAEIELGTRMTFNQGKTQVFSIEAQVDSGAQTPAFAKKNILVYAGEYGIYRKDDSYGTMVNTPLSLPVSLVANKSGAKLTNINLTAKVKLSIWVKHQEPDKKYPTYKEEITDLPDLNAKTDAKGDAVFNFTPQKIGSYAITAQGSDSRGNTISKTFYSYVSAENQPFYNSDAEEELTISTDKQKYAPGETVQLKIFSQIPDRDIFFSLERGRVSRFQIIRLNGASGSLEVPLQNSDMPNIFAQAQSFSAGALNSSQTNIIVSPESKKIAVNLTPNNLNFGPGETVTVDISTKDAKGNPVSSDVALWAVDKAIFELSDNKLGDIFTTFWNERYNTTEEAHSLEGILVRMAEGGGCFAKGTKILMAEDKIKNIEDVKKGDYILTRDEKDQKLIKAKVLGTHSAEAPGYLILNSHLKVTANHILRINNSWKEAGSMQTGDTLTDQSGGEVKINSIEWQSGKFKVYNLEIEKYHTYFADGLWVHNEKGIDRNAFKDTAYWNPSVHTDENGLAKVSFKLPDNLTTWTIAAVAATTDTKVGQTTAEITVNKDLVIRPILPNILRVGDEIVLSALVQNFTENAQNLDIDLKFDSGNVGDERKQNVQIKSNSMQEFFWKVKPDTENPAAKLTFGARSKADKNLADIVTLQIPVKNFGFERKLSYAAEGPKTFDVKLAPDSHREKSQITLSLSPAITGSLPSAMKYLINYPYGCTEQTTSTIVPAIIAKLNPDLYGDALKDKNTDDILQKGVKRLESQQQSDGGWTWWGRDNSNPFVSAYVLEYLLLAQKSGTKVNAYILNQAKSYLLLDKYYDSSQEKKFSNEEIISKNYGLALLGQTSTNKLLPVFPGLTPDLLSLLVMSNYLNGDTNPQTNGLNALILMAREQGNALFWEAGTKINFGSRDASTALAIRAILLTNGDRELAAKGARFLTRNRQSDYWSNTFATAQVLRALTEFAKSTEEQTPAYSYAVTIDGKQIAGGTVSDPKQSIKDINIPAENIKSSGSKIAVTKNGSGQIYSTLTVNELRTDKNSKAENNGLTVKREYVNEKNPQFGLGVGDTALVKITVGGLKTEENYAVIQDELPSGMIPINESFENEQYGNMSFNSNQVTEREITENGIILSLYQIPAGEKTYTYRARVVSEGTFLTPPGVASLMYAPEISGSSNVQKINIAKKAERAPEVGIIGQKQILAAAVILIVLTVVIFMVIIRVIRKKQTPPQTPNDN